MKKKFTTEEELYFVLIISRAFKDGKLKELGGILSKIMDDSK